MLKFCVILTIPFGAIDKAHCTLPRITPYGLIASEKIANEISKKTIGFVCENIKEKKIRASCIEARAVSEKATKEEAINEFNEKAALTASQNELAKAVVVANEALKSLKKLNAKVETGISYQNYPSALADVKFEVGQFIESPASKKLPEAALSLATALGHFEKAHELWRYKFSSGEVVNQISSVWAEAKFDGFLSAHYYFYIKQEEREFIDDLALKYPGIAKEHWRNPSYKYAALPLNYPKNGTEVYIDTGLSIIWKAAAEEIRTATNFLNQ